ncbi:TPA: hypothetical protein EYO12_03195 [Candidatus Saccharibacteria bacterium]|nr:hypothetical protein [Candidatus Saccharibacteria bacterium]HIO87961.1 hypothetical protein [Candidatus Saccharibacteria bacterium]
MRLPKNVISPLGLSRYQEHAALVYSSKRRGHGKLGLALSEDGLHFNESVDAPVIFTGQNKTESIADTSDYRFAKVAHDHLLTYTKNGRLVIAREEESGDLWDLAIWKTLRTGNPRATNGMFVPEYKYNNQYVLFYNTSSINFAVTKDFKDWHSPYRPVLEPRRHNFDNKSLKIVSVANISSGIAVLYESQSMRKRQQTIHVGFAVFSRQNPGKLIWRSEGPLWAATNAGRSKIELLGADIQNDSIRLYGSSVSNGLFTVDLQQPLKLDEVSRPKFELERHHKNPLLSPEGGEHWESSGVFNPSVVHHEGKVHILYRAVDPYGVSHVGYASTTDGSEIDYRHNEPCYWPRAWFEAGRGKRPYKEWNKAFGSGGGWGGCEDPKATLMDDKVYMTYVAHDGSPYLRLCITSIDIDDFVNHRWDKWAWPKVISNPQFGPHVNPPFGVRVIKSGIILPEKINDKYVIFFKEPPHVGIHYIDDIERLGIDEELEAHDFIYTRPGHWDSQKLSMGSTPILVNEGWLVIYHAVDKREGHKYKIGAMLLDKNDPSKVLRRTNTPILEPDADYENNWKPGVAYPSGAAIIGDQLHVYYGGGDRHVCVATTPLQEFMDHLMNEEEIHLTAEVTVS